MMDCKHGILPSKRCCNGCNEMDNMLYKCNQEIVKQTCKVEQLEQQLAAANAELEAERNNRVVTCVYCGHEYPDGTPTSQDEKLTEHIKVCDKHPMRELEQQLADAIIRIEAQAKRLEAAEAVCTAVKECLPTIHVMDAWQKVKEGQ